MSEASAQGSSGQVSGITAQITFRSGYIWDDGKGGVLADLRRVYTMSRRDFSGRAAEIEGSVNLRSHHDVYLAGLRTGSAVKSQYREWISTDGSEIEQNTTLRRTSIALGYRYTLTDRMSEQSVAQSIVQRLDPYLGAAAGMIAYRLHQLGDFVDFQTLAVHHRSVESKGRAPLGQVAAGLNVAVRPWMDLNGQVTYLWARTKLRPDWNGVDEIDLSSTTLGFGLRLRY